MGITTMTKTSDLALLRLMQLVSPALPVGAYAYSQGMEYAIHLDWINNEQTSQQWIEGIIKNNLMKLDVPIICKMYKAWQDNDLALISYWSDFLHASRETKELQLEDQQLGKALAKLLVDLNITSAEGFLKSDRASFACLFSLACERWNIEQKQCVQGYLWAWCENQVAAATKLVPLGQTAGQRILSSLQIVITDIIHTIEQQKNKEMKDEEIGMSLPGLSMASALHEVQYSRLFRS